MSFPKYPAYKDSGVEWLGEVPEHWLVKRYKQVFSERGERSLDGSEELMSVSAYYGVRPRAETLDEGDHLSRAESLEGYKICRKNDLVMNIMLAWNRGLGFSWQDGIVSPAYCVFHVIDGSNPNYLDYLVRSDDATRYFKAYSAGVIDSRLRLYPETFGRLYVAIPPAVEQAQIARFLDHETARIDVLIEEQQCLIELLKEKRQAVISHAVTKGLDPSVPMKDSGVKWLGEVPAHWVVQPLMSLTAPGRAIMYGIVLPGENVEVGIPIVKGGDVKPGRLELDRLCRTTKEIEAPFARARLRPKDIVYSIRGTIGDAELVPDELHNANITQDVARISPRDRVDSGWLLYVMKSNPVFFQLEQRSLGAAVRGINICDLKRARVPVPPESEQVKIAEFLEMNVARLNELIAEATSGIDLLKERRSALISAAVTGKIDLRGWQPPASTTASIREQETA